MHIDKLGREIHVGDIVAEADYANSIFVGKVTKVSSRAVSFTLYRGKGPGKSLSPSYTLSMEDLATNSLSNWNCWTKNSEKRLIILRKYKK